MANSADLDDVTTETASEVPFIVDRPFRDIASSAFTGRQPGNILIRKGCLLCPTKTTKRGASCMFSTFVDD